MLASLFRPLLRALRRRFGNEDGVIAVETVVITPFLLMGLLFSFEYYDMFRQQSLMEKATYTVTDALSRENGVIDDTYIDNLKTTFDMMVGARNPTQLRVSVVHFHAAAGGSYELRWSEVRGTGELIPLTQAHMDELGPSLPIMINGQDLILVESTNLHRPLVTNGLVSDQQMNSRMFMTLRFASQLCFVGVCTPTS